MLAAKRRENTLDASVTTTAAAERARRQKAVDSARRSIRLEGFELDAETEALNQRYIDGEMTSLEHSAAIRKSAGR